MPLKLYSRGGIWHYRGSVAGRRLRGSAKTTDKAIAARQIAELEARQWKCNFDGPEAVLTFAQAALKYRMAGKSGWQLDKIEDYFKDTLVRAITPDAIQGMAMQLYGHCSGASRNRLAIVPAQAVINHAAESKLCQRIRVKRFKTETKEKHHATLEWVRAFQAQASPHLGAFALFMFLTGARPSEAINADINLVTRTALVHESKIGHKRRAHLPDLLFVTLANLARLPGRPIFVYRSVEDLRDAWDGVIARAGIERLTPHCCRHGFITGLLRRGIDVKTAAWLADMTPEVLLNTYAHAIKDRTLTDVLTDTQETQKIDYGWKNVTNTKTS